MFLEYFMKKEGNSNKRRKGVRIICDKCFKTFERIHRNQLVIENNILYDRDYCNNCWRSILNNRPEYLKNMSKSIIKMYRNKPEIRDKKRKSMMGKNIGILNGMKQEEARKKVSESRKKLFLNPEFKKKHADMVRKAWSDGKFEGVRTGQCKWFEYKHSNGKIYKLQGTWELAFIKWLDKNNMKFECHKKWIPYILNGKKKNWYPDFYVYQWNAYIDVKCEHFYVKEKFDAIEKCNPKIKVKVLFKKDLDKLGVII
jgi:hypothetical protein